MAKEGQYIIYRDRKGGAFVGAEVKTQFGQRVAVRAPDDAKWIPRHYVMNAEILGVFDNLSDMRRMLEELTRMRIREAEARERVLEEWRDAYNAVLAPYSPQ